ncbi:MAG: hypothetical protein K2Q01_03960, partial [Rickettsiales bacterium]|nr:hypothetical protein [Rickettsiales bacterium]
FACVGAIYFAKSPRPVLWGSVVMTVIVMAAPVHLLVWGLIWVLGLVTFFYCESPRWKLPVWFTLPLFFASLAVSRLKPEEVEHAGRLVRFGYDAFIGVAYALLLSSLYAKQKTYLPWARLHRVLADFSYTLYLVHFPLLIVLVAGLHDRFGVRFLVQPDAAGIGYFMALCAVLMAYAFVFSRLTEAHTQRVRAWLSRRF